MLDPNLILAGQAPQNPLDQYSKVLALKNALAQQSLIPGQQQLQQQQIQGGALENQQRQMLLSDQQKFSKVLSDPEVAGDFGKALPRLGAAGVSANMILSATKAYQENQSAIANTRKAQSEADEANNRVNESQQSLVSDMLQGLGPQATAAQLQAHANLLKTISPNLAPKIDPLLTQMLNAQDPDAFARQTVQSATGAKGQATAADTAEKAAGAAQKQAEAARLKKFNDLLDQGAKPPTGVHPVDAIFNGIKVDPAVIQSYKAAYDNALPTSAENPFGGKNDILKAASAHAASASAANDPNLIAGAAKKAAAEANATEPIKAKANADAQAYLMKQVGGPLQNVMDPAERARVSADYLKANDAYAEKAADAQRLKDFIAAAKTGNQSAAGLLTTAELRTIVNRVNSVELNNAGGGSIVRRITNGLDKAGTGIPSADTLKDIEQVANLSESSARGGFAQKVRGIKTLSPKANLSETPIGAPAASDSGWKILSVK